MNKGYIPKDQRKNILLIGDDIRANSGVATILREIVIGTSPIYNWRCIAGAIKHPEQGKRLDLSEDTNKHANITDSSVIIYPTDGYGSPEMVRELIKLEKVDALFIMTDPRYYVWLFQMEHEIRTKIPIIYLNIWDDLPYPMYNKAFYESCDTLLAISKQTENINRVVLGDKAKDKVIKFTPHGINEKYFYPITNDKPEYLTLQQYKKDLFREKEYDFVVLWNSRNIRRKCTPDLMLAWKIFLDSLPKEQKDKCVLVLHTNPVDENGTNLFAVKEMLFDLDESRIIFSDKQLSTPGMNLLYNCADVVTLISSNEGWGLSLTEAMMCGKPIIGNVSGGMQDQYRFEDEKGEWIRFTEEFATNHRGKYKNHGEWALPIFPSNISLVGSVPTPYIYDDRVDPQDIANQFSVAYNLKTVTPAKWKRMGEAGAKWVRSDEAMMTADNMCKNVIDGIEETFSKWTPKEAFELLKIESKNTSLHYNKFPIAR